jgi:hypothetical protein
MQPPPVALSKDNVIEHNMINIRQLCNRIQRTHKNNGAGKVRQMAALPGPGYLAGRRIAPRVPENSITAA